MDAPLRQYHGWNRFPDDLAASEITHFFSLSEDERRTVDRRRRPLKRLGVALQIGFLRLAGTSLNSVEMIPPRVLAHLGIELGIAPPRLASIRAVYRRRRTLFEHQEVAKRTLGLHDLTEHGERALNGHLRREAGDKFLVDDLERTARAWLADHKYIQLPSRPSRRSQIRADRLGHRYWVDDRRAVYRAFRRCVWPPADHCRGNDAVWRVVPAAWIYDRVSVCAADWGSPLACFAGRLIPRSTRMVCKSNGFMAGRL